MKLTKVQLSRAITVTGLLGSKDFLTSGEADLEIKNGMLLITTPDGATLVPFSNVLYFNAVTSANSPKENNDKHSATTRNKEENTKEEAQHTPAKQDSRSSGAAKSPRKPR